MLPQNFLMKDSLISTYITLISEVIGNSCSYTKSGAMVHKQE